MRRPTAKGLLVVLASVIVSGCTSDAPVAPAASPPSVPSLDRESEGGTFFSRASTYAVIGDVPYTETKRLIEFPRLIAQINADPAVSLVVHLGDIRQGKNGVLEPLGGCTNVQFESIRALFDRFDDPLVYTPGDNEWTDCHVASKNNGLFTPTERLQEVRTLFFPVAGLTLGVHKRVVLSEAFDPAHSAYVENTMWANSGVVFAAVNITGSNNDAVPWGTQLPTDAGNYPSQAAEQATRAEANRVWIDRTFAAASAIRAPGVVLLFQADMWDAAEPSLSGFDALVQQIGTRAAAFGKPVLLLEGDSHAFRVDQPFSVTSPLHSLHPSTPVADNVTRVVVEGALSATEYLRLTIDPGSPSGLFTWVRVPLAP